MSLLRLLRARTRRSWVYSHPPSGLRVFSSRKPFQRVHHQPSRQISDHREARPPARRPRRELRSARRLGVRGLYVLLVG